MTTIINLYEQIFQERINQDKKWGEQNHAPEFWLTIMTEEVGEVAKEICESKMPEIGIAYRYQTLQKLRAELIQTAAVAVAFIESLDRNELNIEGELNG